MTRYTRSIQSPVRAILIALCLTLVACAPESDPPPTALDAETARLGSIASRVEIIRDDFGVPHVYSKTDADTVFGLMYAQAEDDFPRVERNYIWATGRLAEVEGEAAIYIAVLILLAIACVFTVAGGLSAVIWTDFVQTVLMILGSLALCAIGEE